MNEQEFRKDALLIASRLISNFYSSDFDSTKKVSVGTGFFINVLKDVLKNDYRLVLIFDPDGAEEPFENRYFGMRYHNTAADYNEESHTYEEIEGMPDLKNVTFDTIGFYCDSATNNLHRSSVTIGKTNLRSINISSAGDVYNDEGNDAFCCSLMEDSILKDTDPQLFLGQEVFYVGYPDHCFDVVHNLPVLQKACIASDPKVDFDGKPQFLIDTEVASGSNGSPLFVRLSDGQFKLAGVLAQPSEAGTRIGAVNKISVVNELIAKEIEEWGFKPKVFDDFPTSLV